jgi:hypothetical protein
VQLEGTGQDRIFRSLDCFEDTFIHDLPDAKDLLIDLIVCVPQTLLVLVHQLSDSEVVFMAEIQQALRIVERICRAAKVLGRAC